MDTGQVRTHDLVGVFLDVDRLRLIALLVDEEQTVTELASRLGLKPQAVVRHIQTLEECRLIRRSAERPTAVRLDVSRLQQYALALRPESSDDSATGSDADARTLRGFVVDGKLANLPSQRSRWLVVLAWLVEKFDHDRRYSEAEVNETLSAFHEDYALLRRQLVDERFMARDHGVYWRIEPPDGT
ncbi:MAG: DUF2087 domain-containing protein [Thermomicrobiales bacterium]